MNKTKTIDEIFDEGIVTSHLMSYDEAKKWQAKVEIELKDHAKQALADHILGLPSLQEHTEKVRPNHARIALINGERRKIRQEIAEALGVKKS